MGVLDFSIVNVALPSIQRMFHLAPADLQWVVSNNGPEQHLSDKLPLEANS